MAEPFYFICYSRHDGEKKVISLADELTAGPPSISVWLDRRDIEPGIDWDEQVVSALRECAGILYVMTEDSVRSNSECKREWTRALKYNKPIIPLLFHKDAEMPFRLEPRQHIDFTGAFDVGLAKLRNHLGWRATPQGLLHSMNERLKDAQRDLLKASPGDKVRIEEDITQLQHEIATQQASINNPEQAKVRTQQSIDRGLERERQPEEPVALKKKKTRFINRPPLIAPTYFQNRHVETGLIGDFLKKDNMRLMTVVGRGGVGKTAMVCRLLRSLENGKLPDDGGELTLDGIVYLSARSGHPVNFPNLFYDLCELLPEESAKYLDQIYKDAKQSVKSQMQTLLTEFPRGRIVVLLDNFEDVVDAETQAINEGELDEALHAVLEAPPHGLKFLLTTRVSPQALFRVRPGVQDVLPLDEGLKSPYAENVLKAMDTSGTLGLKAADAPLAEVREATRGLPRALEAVVGILRTDRSTDLRGLLEELRQLGSKAEDVVRDLVGEAFSRLDPLAQEVMQALAVYGVPVPAVAVDYLLQPYRIGIDSSKILSRLVNMHFVRGESGRFYLHQVDRDYALSRIEEGEPGDRVLEPPPISRYALRHRAAEYFKETRKPREAWKTLEDLAAQLAEFDQRLAGEDYDAAASVLIEIDYDYLSVWGHYRLLVERYKLLQGKLNDSKIEFDHSQGLGSAYVRTGQFEKAISCLEKNLTLARTLDDKHLEAACLSSLAWAYGDANDKDKAIEFNRQAIDMYQELGDKNGEGICRGNHASFISQLGRSDEAIEQYEKAIALHKESRDRQAECRDTCNLAVVYADKGASTTARYFAEDALRQALDLGFRMIQSTMTSLQAILMVRTGRFDEAIKLYEHALQIADDINDVQEQMNTRRSLAVARLLSGDLARARTAADEAAKYLYPSSYASVLAVGGLVALRQADLAEARKWFDNVLREVGSKAKDFESAYARALALSGLALCRGDASLAEAAVQAYRDARAISNAPGIVTDVLLLHDALAVADVDGMLTAVRAAAAGEE